MRTKITILLSILSISLLVSCTTDSIKSGVKGNLQYGEGSCLFDHSFWTYTPYSGYVYFVNTSIKDSFNGSNSDLLNLSDSTISNGGKFSAKLEPGNYYICIREYIIFSQENLFIVQPNLTTDQNFWIYKCI
jgi:hypothetical protein